MISAGYMWCGSLQKCLHVFDHCPARSWRRRAAPGDRHAGHHEHGHGHRHGEGHDHNHVGHHDHDRGHDNVPNPGQELGASHEDGDYYHSYDPGTSHESDHGHDNDHDWRPLLNSDVDDDKEHSRGHDGDRKRGQLSNPLTNHTN